MVTKSLLPTFSVDQSQKTDAAVFIIGWHLDQSQRKVFSEYPPIYVFRDKINLQMYTFSSPTYYLVLTTKKAIINQNTATESEPENYCKDGGNVST